MTHCADGSTVCSVTNYVTLCAPLLISQFAGQYIQSEARERMI